MKRALFLTVTYALFALMYSALGLWSIFHGGRNVLALLEIFAALVNYAAAVVWALRIRRERKTDGQQMPSDSPRP